MDRMIIVKKCVECPYYDVTYCPKINISARNMLYEVHKDCTLEKAKEGYRDDPFRFSVKCQECGGSGDTRKQMKVGDGAGGYNKPFDLLPPCPRCQEGKLWYQIEKHIESGSSYEEDEIKPLTVGEYIKFIEQCEIEIMNDIQGLMVDVMCGIEERDVVLPDGTELRAKAINH